MIVFSEAEWFVNGRGERRGSWQVVAYIWEGEGQEAEAGFLTVGLRGLAAKTGLRRHTKVHLDELDSSW